MPRMHYPYFGNENLKDDEDKDNKEGFENFAEEEEDFKDKGNPVFL